MHYRKYEPSFVQEQFIYRRTLFDSLHAFALADFKETMEYKDAIISSATVLAHTCGKKEKPFFTALEHLTTALFQVMEYFDKLLSASPDAATLRVAANLHVQLAATELAKCDPDRPSVQSLTKLGGALAAFDDITGLETIVAGFKKVALPLIYTIHSRDRIQFSQPDIDAEADPTPENPIISVLFYFDNELWANPQVIKPNHLYTLSGSVKVNFWPEGYSTLNLLPVSTTDNSWYNLSLPSLSRSTKEEFPINGYITINAPQSWLDPPIAIRLYAYYSGPGIPDWCPAVIGYDQLILKVVDSNSFPFPTGYDSLNKKAFEITSQIMKEIPNIDREELNSFLILLSAILNYQGYCYQYSIYKGRTDVSEAEFRDALIGHLSARSNLSESVVKEGVIAGGRVEINFKGIVAELKLEKSQSEREKVMQAHEQQAVAYAAATGSRLSILCILDLTPKKNAPAPARWNVYLRKPQVHGFAADDSPSRLVAIFIDGNLPNPSAY